VAEQISAKLSLDIRDALRGIESFTKSANQQIASVQSSFSVIGTVAKTVGGLIAAAGIAKVFHEITQAAIDQEEAINELNGALRSSGQFTEEVSKDFQEFAEQLQRQTKVQDDTIVKTAAYIQTLAQLDPTNLKLATQATLDLAAATGKDLNTSANLVAKAANGQTEALKKLGIEVVKGKNDAETFANALGKIEEKAGGRATAQVNTFAGAIAQAGNAFNSVLAELGGFVTQNTFVIESIKSLTGFLFQVKDAIALFGKESEAISAHVGEIAKRVATFAVSMAAALAVLNFGAIAGAGIAAFQAISFGIRAAIAQISLLGTAATLAKVKVVGLQVALTVLKAVATLGLAIAFDAALTSLLHLKEEVGSFTNAFAVIGKKIAIGFNEGYAVILGGLAAISDRLASIPFLSGRFDFTGIADGLRKGADEATATVGQLGKEIQSLKVPDELPRAIASVNDKLKETTKTAKEAKNQLAEVPSELASQLDRVKKDLEKVGLSQIQILQKERNERLKIIGDSANFSLTSAKEAASLRAKVEMDFDKKIADERDKIRKKQLEDELKDRKALAKRIEFLGSAPGAFINRNLDPGEGQAPLANTEEAVAQGTALTKSILQGAAGATTLVSNILGSVAETILPGIGKIAGEIIGVLAQGPEKVKELVTSFFSSLDDIIINIIAAIPALVSAILESLGPLLISLLTTLPQAVLEAVFTIIDMLPEIVLGFVTALIENLPYIIESFTTGLVERLDDIILGLILLLPQLIQGFIQQLPVLIAAIIQQLPTIITNFSTQLVAQAPKIAVGLITALIAEAPRFITALASGIFEAIKNIFKGILGGGEGGGFLGKIPVIGGIGKLLGFAEGGVVPSGFPNDNFPMRATSGELIIDRSLTTDLANFLNSSERAEAGTDPELKRKLDSLIDILSRDSGKELTVNVSVAEQDLVKVMTNIKQNGFRTG